MVKNKMFFNELNNDFLISYRKLIFIKDMSRHLIILNHVTFISGIFILEFLYKVLSVIFLPFKQHMLLATDVHFHIIFKLNARYR